MSDTNFIRENNARFFWGPMAHPGELRAAPPRVIARGEGVEIVDIDGHRTLDGVGGLWCANLGHSAEAVKAAIVRQLAELPYYNTFRSTTNIPVIELSYALKEYFAPEGLTRVFLTSGGSDSVETALRLARQFHRVNGEPERTKFFSLRKGYHGTHFGAASVNGNPNFRRNYEPMLPGCHHLPSPSTYRSEFATEDGAEIARAIARAFEEAIAFEGASTIAALIMEPVLGAGGVIVPHPTLFPLMREICTRHGILLVADEVITAFGRVGAACGARLWGIRPDLVTMAKALTNGYFPLGGVMLSETIATAFEANADTRATISHGYTYSGHPVGAAAALAALSEIRRLDVAANARARGSEILEGFGALMARHAIVGDVRGQGLMLAIELVADRAARTPAARGVVQAVFERTYAAGLMIRTSGNTLILSPPLIIDRSHVGRILEALDAGLAAGGAAAAAG
ncbi:MAG: aminotransferase class III-fold pyridoxal phosphate-dependent enzyme [Rhodobacteraceae bacterium]|nr:aminotransferase class III-fold pyridoxal phosphate-dependent enzyme [Paracoccaceae bacterium]